MLYFGQSLFYAGENSEKTKRYQPQRAWLWYCYNCPFIIPEDHVVDVLGGDKSIVKFTEAARPRPINPPYREVPVCTRCEPKYGRDAFPPGARFKSDQ